jgi:hypothetical protein
LTGKNPFQKLWMTLPAFKETVKQKIDHASLTLPNRKFEIIKNGSTMVKFLSLRVVIGTEKKKYIFGGFK